MTEVIINKLKRIRHVVLDMDGTIYSGKILFPTTLPFLELLNSMQIGYTFLTNNSSKSVSEYLVKLAGLGIFVERDQMLTSTLSLIDFLKKNHPEIKKVYALGTDSFKSEFENAGFHITFGEPDAVITGFDTNLDYSRLCKTAYWIRDGKLWFASHPDVECPTDEAMVMIDCGAITECLKTVTNREPDKVLGKPAPEMIEALLDIHGVEREEMLMVGDRLNTDIQLARNAGINGALIASEKCHSVPEGQTLCVIEHLGELGEMLIEAKNASIKNKMIKTVEPTVHSPQSTARWAKARNCEKDGSGNEKEKVYFSH
jgi:HAD superfamily hydrolase (TIGR01450 family)